ncbi:MAG: DUF1194 domain-containing protein [Pseudomonadota bacterium]
MIPTHTITAALRRLFGAAFVFLATAHTLTAQPACRQALVLALDVSGSVDAREYALQRQGLIAALTAPAVVERMFEMPAAPIDLAVFEWSGRRSQWLVMNWVTLATPADLDRVVATLSNHERKLQTDTATAIGSAMRAGLELTGARGHCWKRTIDISGDGRSIQGPEPADTRAEADAQGVTVNGLVIGTDNPRGGDIRQVELAELSAYYRSEVITGPGAFVEAALGFADFEAAMTRKLLKEMEGIAIGMLAPSEAVPGPPVKSQL